MFILVNIIVISALLLILLCLTFVILLMTCILTNFLVVFNSGGGEYLYHESFINLVLYSFEERKNVKLSVYYCILSNTLEAV